MRGPVLNVSPHPDDELLGAPATLMALRNRTAPPTVGLEEPDLEQGLDLNYVPGEPQPIESRNGNGNGRLVALSNSFAFGGHNATVAITT